jgi:hypothetical protein
MFNKNIAGSYRFFCCRYVHIISIKKILTIFLLNECNVYSGGFFDGKISRGCMLSLNADH